MEIKVPHPDTDGQPPNLSPMRAALEPIELTWTPVTGRVNVSCAAHLWWGRDQIRPDFGSLWQAVAVHAVTEHGFTLG
jgi:hypothetical protein